MSIMFSFAEWHFIQVPKFLLHAWKNFIEFSVNYFSTPLLLKTLFSPWRRYKWGYPRGFDVGVFLETFISNIFSRILGAICRVTLIIVGVVFQLFVFITGAIIFIGWFVLPAILFAGLLFSFGFI